MNNHCDEENEKTNGNKALEQQMTNDDAWIEIINNLAEEIGTGNKSRGRALAITKLQEAAFWLQNDSLAARRGLKEKTSDTITEDMNENPTMPVEPPKPAPPAAQAIMPAAPLAALTAQEEIELARTYNASLQPDAQRGPAWSSFKLHGWFIWMHGRWTAAKYKNREFTDHQFFDTLKDTFEFCSKNK